MAMKLVNSLAPSIIEFAGIQRDNGQLWFAEINKELPFIVKRIYYILDIPAEAEHAAHAHKKSDQLIIAMNGTFTVEVSDGIDSCTFKADNPGKAIFLPSGLWRTFRHFSKGAICLTLASDCYDADDFIRDYQEFLKWKRQQTNSDA